MGDDKRGRRQAWALRPEQLGDEARVGATLAVAHPESHALVASRTDPNEAIGNRHGRRQAWATTSVGDDKRGRRQASPLHPEQLGDEASRRGDPRGRPSRIPRPRGVPYRPKRGHRETGVGDDKRGRRQASPLHPEQLGDEARVGATLAVAHPESHALVASRTDPNEAIGNRHGRRQAWATTSVGDDKRRPYAPNNSATRPA